MSRATSPGIRNLSHLKPKIYESIQLKGRMTNKMASPQKTRPPMVKWNDFVTKSTVSRVSTAAATPTKRLVENKNAKRTIQPQLNVKKDTYTVFD